MLSAFSTALSALKGDSAAVDVISNNLANLNTTGFKEGTVSFADLVGEAIGAGNITGFGIEPVKISQVYSQGTIQGSSGLLDAAVQGNGFFTVNTASGKQLFTRDGHFQVDASGNLLTASGQFVQGWSSVSGNVNTNGPIANITLPSGVLRQPVSTTQFTLDMNLNSTAVVGSKDGSFSAPIQVFDSLGAGHVLTVGFTKTGSNAWSYTITIPGEDLAGGTAGVPSQLAKGNLAFDQNGQLTTPAGLPGGTGTVPVSVTALADGAANLNINWNVYDPASGAAALTQVAQPSAVATNTQDGAQAAQITKIAMGPGGQITASYGNGQQKVVGVLALAEIRNPESLSGAGGNNLQATAATALPSIGVAGTGGRGDVIGGSLESSTVDIASEFTNLIVMQRSYQANGKVITTADQLTQETLNLKQ